MTNVSVFIAFVDTWMDEIKQIKNKSLQVVTDTLTCQIHIHIHIHSIKLDRVMTQIIKILYLWDFIFQLFKTISLVVQWIKGDFYFYYFIDRQMMK